MLVIREIQTGKLKEFNEVVKEKINRSGEKAAAAWTRGGNGVGSELHFFIWNQTGMMDCYYVDVVIMQNDSMSRRCFMSVLSSRQMNTGRQSGLVELKLQERGLNKPDKEQLSVAEHSMSWTAASIKSAFWYLRAYVHAMLETGLLLAWRRRTEAAAKH